jgi:predicted ATP-dependent endonuclease of OLD family
LDTFIKVYQIRGILIDNMKHLSIRNENYRSILDNSFNFEKLKDDSLTFGLIGVNEAGKSSILKALALGDGLIKLLPKDFRDRSKPVLIIYKIELEKNEKDEVARVFGGDSKTNQEWIIAKPFELAITFDYATPEAKKVSLIIDGLDKSIIEAEDEVKLSELLNSKLPKAIFWTAEDRYLISQPINLTEFSSNPESISIPLRNCFFLAGISNISERINNLTDSTEKEDLQTQLGEKVSEHIKNVWPSHPIKITFLISDGLIHFHVKDDGSKGKAKTADQRSDGFKQFVSFLLTVSAQSKNQELSRSILLLDEPETHLHPQAQEYLLNELINISKGNKENIVLFATHSNYMIDKKDLSRNYRIIKKSDQTEKERFNTKPSSYASVTYEVYEIASNDYHNELYGALQEREDKFTEAEFEKFLEDKGVPKDKDYTKVMKDGKKSTYKVTLPTKIRNDTVQLSV